jgi:hypothetical protein
VKCIRFVSLSVETIFNSDWSQVLWLSFHREDMTKANLSKIRYFQKIPYIKLKQSLFMSLIIRIQKGYGHKKCLLMVQILMKKGKDKENTGKQVVGDKIEVINARKERHLFVHIMQRNS